MTAQDITAQEHATLETLHGELLHESAALEATGNQYDSWIARARAATLASLLWGPA